MAVLRGWEFVLLDVIRAPSAWIDDIGHRGSIKSRMMRVVVSSCEGIRALGKWSDSTTQI